MYNTTVLEQTPTLKLTKFEHLQGNRYTLLDRVGEGTWRMVCTSPDERFIRKIFKDMAAGEPLRPLSYYENVTI